MQIRTYILIAAGIGMSACVQKDEKQPVTTTSAAEQMAQIAPTPEQAELWKAAGGTTASLDHVPVATRAVQSRARSAVQSQALQPQAAALTARQVEEAPNVARILAAPELPDGAFRGTARIVSMEGDRVEFDLGNDRRLSVAVRIKATALRAQTGDTAQVEFRKRDDPYDRAEVFAFKAGGQGLVSVLEGATKPVTVNVALYSLTATQVGEVAQGAMPVQVTVGGERKTLTQGQTADFARAGITVGIVASQATTGEAVNREEGNPYAIRLLAWPTQ